MKSLKQTLIQFVFLSKKKRETKPLSSSLSFSDLERSWLKQQDETAEELNHVSLHLSAVFFNPYW